MTDSSNNLHAVGNKAVFKQNIARETWNEWHWTTMRWTMLSTLNKRQFQCQPRWTNDSVSAIHIEQTTVSMPSMLNKWLFQCHPRWTNDSFNAIHVEQTTLSMPSTLNKLVSMPSTLNKRHFQCHPHWTNDSFKAIHVEQTTVSMPSTLNKWQFRCHPRWTNDSFNDIHVEQTTVSMPSKLYNEAECIITRPSLATRQITINIPSMHFLPVSTHLPARLIYFVTDELIYFITMVNRCQCKALRQSVVVSEEIHRSCSVPGHHALSHRSPCGLPSYPPRSRENSPTSHHEDQREPQNRSRHHGWMAYWLVQVVLWHITCIIKIIIWMCDAHDKKYLI